MAFQSSKPFSRRDFIKYSAAGAASLSALNLFSGSGCGGGARSRIALIRTDDRAEGVSQAMRLARFRPPAGKKVLIKPNFNTADPTPGSTHNDTLARIVEELRERGAGRITVGDRSGPQPTAEVLELKGILEMGSRLDFDVINFSELPDEDWLPFNFSGSHWDDGFLLARPVAESGYTVSTCCLKTHQFGGVFTLSLKNWVGAAPRKLMRQMHRSEHMRRMIAELNQPFAPDLVVLDGIEAYVDGGPAKGEKKTANVFIAGTDRVAVDAVGLAVLRHLGSNEAIMSTPIFEQEQIRRAVEMGLGVSGPDRIELVTADQAGASYAREIEKILAEG
ncbi:MAG TPA: DUF362 domain-containing protein [bacterium]|nr:DUF362 domain-containing protein [bacterium]